MPEASSFSEPEAASDSLSVTVSDAISDVSTLFWSKEEAPSADFLRADEKLPG